MWNNILNIVAWAAVIIFFAAIFKSIIDDINKTKEEKILDKKIGLIKNIFLDK